MRLYENISAELPLWIFRIKTSLLKKQNTKLQTLIVVFFTDFRTTYPKYLLCIRC